MRHVTRTHKINLSGVFDQFKDPAITLQYVNTKEQAADIFTKALGPQLWDNALRNLGILYSDGTREESAPESTAAAAPVLPKAPVLATAAPVLLPSRSEAALTAPDPSPRFTTAHVASLSNQVCVLTTAREGGVGKLCTNRRFPVTLTPCCTNMYDNRLSSMSSQPACDRIRQMPWAFGSSS
jgi:hypothetical protein